MDLDHNKVSQRVVEDEEDRLSSLPDELIHKILSCFDMKFVVRTCLLLSKRWKLLWTSLPCLNFYNWKFGCLPKFTKFVSHVLSHRNPQVDVSSVELDLQDAVDQGSVESITNYAFSHNVQELTVLRLPLNHFTNDPRRLFSSQSLKHFTLTCSYFQIYSKIKTRLNFPALTTMNLSFIRLCGDDVFSKCVNLKKLTLQHFRLGCRKEAFDIITPRLSSLILIDGSCFEVINLKSPQLENLTIIDCEIKCLNAPSGLSSLCYTSNMWHDGVVEFINERFHSLNKVTICLSVSKLFEAYKERYARKTINLLKELHSARYLTLNEDVVEWISSFPDFLLQHSSPFSNLICLTINSSLWRVGFANEVKMSTKFRTFLLENSPNATLIMK